MDCDFQDVSFFHLSVLLALAFRCNRFLQQLLQFTETLVDARTSLPFDQWLGNLWPFKRQSLVRKQGKEWTDLSVLLHLALKALAAQRFECGGRNVSGHDA